MGNTLYSDIISKVPDIIERAMAAKRQTAVAAAQAADPTISYLTTGNPTSYGITPPPLNPTQPNVQPVSSTNPWDSRPISEGGMGVPTTEEQILRDPRRFQRGIVTVNPTQPEPEKPSTPAPVVSAGVPPKKEGWTVTKGKQYPDRFVEAPKTDNSWVTKKDFGLLGDEIDEMNRNNNRAGRPMQRVADPRNTADSFSITGTPDARTPEAKLAEKVNDSKMYGMSAVDRVKADIEDQKAKAEMTTASAAMKHAENTGGLVKQTADDKITVKKEENYNKLLDARAPVTGVDEANKAVRNYSIARLRLLDSGKTIDDMFGDKEVAKHEWDQRERWIAEQTLTDRIKKSHPKFTYKTEDALKPGTPTHDYRQHMIKEWENLLNPPKK